MKRIILGISVLLMLVQNGFSRTNAEWDKMVDNEPDKVWKQLYRCNKASNKSNKYTADVNICIKAIELTNKNRYVLKEGAKEYKSYTNAGIIYISQGNKVSAYKYFMKAAKLGSIVAQENLNILCKQSPWACK